MKPFSWAISLSPVSWSLMPTSSTPFSGFPLQWESTKSSTVVTLIYETLFLVYFKPSSSYSAGTGMVASVVNIVVTPMLNSFIYSLRNRDMKEALCKFFNWGKSSTQSKGISHSRSSGSKKCLLPVHFHHYIENLKAGCFSAFQTGLKKEECLTWWDWIRIHWPRKELQPG